MDVNTIAKTQPMGVANAYGVMKKQGIQGAGNDSSNSLEAKIGEAFEVSISSEGKEANEKNQAKGLGADPLAALQEGELEQAKGKGLDADTISAMQQDIQQKSLQFMIDMMTENNDRLQKWLDEGVGILRFENGVELDAAQFAMPEVATTPEEAEAAISEGGQWSVEAVSDRIFGMASALAGDDPEMLEKMRSAVEEGFKQAGIAFNNVYGTDKMPQITEDTHAEIMRRFDDRAKELTGATAAQMQGASE